MLIIEFLVRLLFRPFENVKELCTWGFLFFSKMSGTTNSNCISPSDIPSKESFSRGSNDN